MPLRFRLLFRHCRPQQKVGSNTLKTFAVRNLATTKVPPENLSRNIFRSVGCNLTQPFVFSFRAPFSTQIPRPYVDSKLSYVFGRSNEHLIYSTVPREFERRVREAPDEVAIINYNENKQATFRQLSHDVNQVAKSMIQSFNIRKGDCVGIFAYNCYNWFVTQLACSRVGAILIPINPSYKSDELAFILKKGKIKCLFMPGPKSSQSELNDHLKVLNSEQIIKMSRASELILEDMCFMDVDHEYDLTKIELKLSNCRAHNWSATKNDGIVYKSVQEAKEAGVDESEACVISSDLISPEDIYGIYFTSGTTGKPKGACISHFTVINNLRVVNINVRTGKPKDLKIVISTLLPMFHIFAGVLGSLSPIVSDSVVVYSSCKYDMKAFVDSIMTYKSNYVMLTPTILIDMLAYIDKNQVKDLPIKVLQLGGAPLAPEVVSRAHKLIPNVELRIGYGSTENGAVATFQTINERPEMRASTVGPPIDFCEIRIVEPGTEKVVQHGQSGEIQTRGYNTMIEYLDAPEKTAEVISPHRWYKTGDIGSLTSDGSLQINGRLKNLIIKGGENIYPEEVQQLILKLDYVEDVHVVGLPDKRYGEQVCAWIKLKEGYKETQFREARKSDKEIHQQDIIEFCKSRITYFKVPKYVLFVAEFPLTPTKKVISHEVIEKSIKILGL